MILWRPVYWRARRMAFSLAAAPPVVRNDDLRSPGVTAAISAASSLRASLAIAGPM